MEEILFKNLSAEADLTKYESQSSFKALADWQHNLYLILHTHPTQASELLQFETKKL